VILAELEIARPHCGRASEDMFEVLDADVIDEMRCESCRAPFWFGILDCNGCGHEQVFTWKELASHAALSLLTCGKCGSAYRPEDASDEQSECL
jgi:hypothetical protein